MSTVIPMTLDEFAALPDEPGKQELLNGELISVPPPKVRHGLIQKRVVAMLSAYAVRQKCGEVFTNVGFTMCGDTCLEPDAALVRTAELAGARPDEWFEGAPALAVEILSPSNRASEIEDKVRSYLDGGADAVWVINPKRRRLTAYDRDGRFHTVGMPDGRMSGEPLFPGLSVPLAALFADL